MLFFSQRSQTHVQLQTLHALWHFHKTKERTSTSEEIVAVLYVKTRSYSVDDFLSVEMASHQHREGVPVLNRHGAEGLQDDRVHLLLLLVCI